MNEYNFVDHKTTIKFTMKSRMLLWCGRHHFNTASYMNVSTCISLDRLEVKVMQHKGQADAVTRFDYLEHDKSSIV